MKVPSKHTFKSLIYGLITICAHSEEKRIYQTDSIGNIQYQYLRQNPQREPS